MNKRQKKKNINNAFKNLKNGELTKQDKHIFKTYGREAFVKKNIVNPEILNVDFEIMLDKFKKFISSVGYAVGETLENIGKNMKQSFGIDKVDDEVN